MAVRKTYLAVIGTALLLGGCSFSSEALWPTLAGDAETTQENVVAAQPIGADATTSYDVAASTAPLTGCFSDRNLCRFQGREHAAGTQPS